MNDPAPVCFVFSDDPLARQRLCKAMDALGFTPLEAASIKMADKFAHIHPQVVMVVEERGAYKQERLQCLLDRYPINRGPKDPALIGFSGNQDPPLPHCHTAMRWCDFDERDLPGILVRARVSLPQAG